MKKEMRPLSAEEQRFTSDNYYLVGEFLRKSKLPEEDFFDVIIIDFLESARNYLNSKELKGKYSFEAVSFMYMKRAVNHYFRKLKAKKRRSEAGADVSFDEVEIFICDDDAFSSVEYRETLMEIRSVLTKEQQMIFSEKLNGYSLKEIAEKNGISTKKVYREFGKIKNIVTEMMEF
jgi:RNA polymerase sigma factor (sigma-70 family)